MLTFSLLITKVKNRFAQFLITLPNTPLGIGSLFNHIIKKWAKQTNSYTQVRVVNNGKKQKASRPGFFIRTMKLVTVYMCVWMVLFVTTNTEKRFSVCKEQPSKMHREVWNRGSLKNITKIIQFLQINLKSHYFEDNVLFHLLIA